MLPNTLKNVHRQRPNTKRENDKYLNMKNALVHDTTCHLSVWLYYIRPEHHYIISIAAYNVLNFRMRFAHLKKLKHKLTSVPEIISFSVC